MNKEAEGQLEELIVQVINGAVSTIPSYIEEVKQNNEILKVKDPQEFVYGIIMGMALGMSGAILSQQEELPNPEEQMKIRDLIYGKMPSIREQVFS